MFKIPYQTPSKVFEIRGNHVPKKPHNIYIKKKKKKKKPLTFCCFSEKKLIITLFKKLVIFEVGRVKFVKHVVYQKKPNKNLIALIKRKLLLLCSQVINYHYLIRKKQNILNKGNTLQYPQVTRCSLLCKVKYRYLDCLDTWYFSHSSMVILNSLTWKRRILAVEYFP